MSPSEGHQLTCEEGTKRLRLVVGGAVQGVGFRPFVYRLAASLRLAGWVENTPQGVTVEVEGPPGRLDEFHRRLETDKPPLAVISSLAAFDAAPCAAQGFDIRHSDGGGSRTAIILPDIATCSPCLADILDPKNRRYRYPFTNCTHCGPRFSIIHALPYDRANTSMKDFVMCDACRREYDDPTDRRFHAQPNACPNCGPHIELWDATSEAMHTHHEALVVAADAVRRGAVLALKGLGGFQLIVDARNERAIAELRRRKHRDEKPLALMVSSLSDAEVLCHVNEQEGAMLQAAQAPIVLLRRRQDGCSHVAGNVAPNNPYLGVMLPYTPLHHLLLLELGFPIVATSGNLSDEPICIDEREAFRRLRGIADVFLVHNRPVVRHVDDSVVQVVCEREMMLRRARGYAPFPIHVSNIKEPILAFGAHQKNTVAMGVDGQVFVSQHIGDLVSTEALSAFDRTVIDLPKLYDVNPPIIACDLHPDYLSTKRAEESAGRIVRVQHHHAHVVSCMADNDIEGTVLGVAWDGTGYGPDGTVWGGEFLRCDRSMFERIAFLHPFLLPGGDLASREPRRSGLGLLFTLLGGALFDRLDLPHFQRCVTPPTAPAGPRIVATGEARAERPERNPWDHGVEVCGPGGAEEFDPAMFQAVGKRCLRPAGAAWCLNCHHGFRPTSSGFTRGYIPSPPPGRKLDRLNCPRPPIQAFAKPELRVLRRVLQQRVNCAVTSSAGRLFDAAASLLGIRQRVHDEGQAAMELEFAAEADSTADVYPIAIQDSAGQNPKRQRGAGKPAALENPCSAAPWIVDWRPMMSALLDDIARKEPTSRMARKFHNSFVAMIVGVARLAGESRVVLSGGCFQNRLLTELAVARLRAEGFEPYWHHRVPPNDGGISLGQVVVAASRLEGRVSCA